MATPTIQIDQVGEPVGTPGASRDDLTTGNLVTLTDPANGAGTYLWTLVDKPAGSAAVLSGAATDTATFTPDVQGTYTVRLVFNGTFDSGSDNLLGEFVSTQGGCGVKNAWGWRKPAAGETEQYNPTRGWAPTVNAIFDDLETRFTLDQVYDGIAGSGAGRSITADSGAVAITNSAADNNNVLELIKNPAGAQSGDAINITMAAAATGHALRSPGIHPIRVGTASGSPTYGYAPINVEDDTTNAWLQVYNGDSGVEGFLWSSSTVDLARFFIGTFSAHPIEFESATICLAVWDGTTTPPASTEQAMWRFDYNDGGSDHRTWGTGALALQRDFLIYNNEMRFDAPSTCDDAVTFEVTGPPKAGTNATITNRTAARILGTATVASAAAVTSTALTIPDYTTTLTGTTQMTATPSIAALRIGTQTITSGSAVTVDQAAALYIEAEPVGSGSTTLTESFAILAAPNSEARFLLGRMRIDSRGATPYWFISHADTTSTTDYAIKGSDGPTGTYRLDLNAGTFGVNFNIDGVEQARFHLNQFYPSAEGKSLGGNGTSQHWSTTYTNRLSLSDATNDIAFIEITDGDTAAVSAASSGRIRYNVATQKLQLSNNTGAYVDIATGAGGNTLDGAYDFGGAGVGRTINATDGAVVIQNSEADTTNILEINKTPAGATAGHGVAVTMSATSTGSAYYAIKDSITSMTDDDVGLYLYNSNAAISQFSPAIRLHNFGDNGASGTQAYEWAVQASAFYQSELPAAQYGRLSFYSNVNDAGWTERAAIVSTGTFLASDGLATAPGYSFLSAGDGTTHPQSGFYYDDGTTEIRTSIAGGQKLALSSTALTLTNGTDLAFAGSSSGTLTHLVPATVTTYSITWPSAQASGTQVLQNDGAGNLSWATAAGGGNTLDGAYDQGGAGSGRTINVTDGAVLLTSADADATNMLEIVINNVSHSGNGLNITTTGTGLGINSCPDTDTGHVFGRTRIDARSTDWAHFSHYDMTGTNQYAVRQTPTGATNLNSATSQATILSINNSAQFKLDATNGFYGNDANGPAVLNEAASSTNPTLVPDRTDLTTGIGTQTPGSNVSVIVNANEILRVGTVGSTSDFYGGGWRHVKTGLGETATIATRTSNTSAATAITQQYGGIIGSEGRAWETTGGSSDAVISGFYTKAISGTVAAAEFTTTLSLNGGAYTDAFAVGGGGTTDAYTAWFGGSNAAVAPANTGRIRYDQTTQKLQYSNNTGAYADIGSGGGNTLDGAYDQGGAGAGRTINATDGAVLITSADADATNMLEIVINNVSHSGNGLNITTTGTGLGINSCPDTNTGHVFGRHRFDARTTDTAYFSHYDNTATADYAIRQDAAGATSLNSKVTQTTVFKLGDSAQFKLDTTNGFYANNANGPAMLNEAPSTTNPVFCPDRADLTSGIGGGTNTITYTLGGAAAGAWTIGAANSSYLTIGTGDASLSGVSRLQFQTDVRTAYIQLDNSTAQMAIVPPTASQSLFVGISGTPWRVSTQHQVWTQSAQSSTPTPFNVEYTYANHTSLTNAEVTDFYINNTHSVQFDGGAGTIATQRAVRIGQPTYDAAASGLTVTNAITMEIAGEPLKGATLDAITNSYALKVASGLSYLADGIFFDEQASAPKSTVAATFGMLWVRNDAPNTLLYTDDENQYIALGKYPEKNVTGATYTIVTSDGPVITCNRAGTIGLTLPSVTQAKWKTYHIKDISGAAQTNNITVTPASGNIDGAANYVLNVNYGAISVWSDGTNWWII